MTFADRITQLRRLLVVQLLADEPGARHSVWILRDALGDLGHVVSASEMAELADWLAAAGLVRFATRDVPPVVEATERGKSLARGDLTVDGVAKPAP